MNSLIETLNNFAAGLWLIAWQMFWQSGLLIVVIFAIDLLLRRKLRASVRHALWLVVLVKLLLPPTLALPTGLAWWLRSGEAPPAVVPARKVVITYPDNVIPFHRPVIPATFVPPAPHLFVQAWIFIFASAISAALLVWLLTRWIQISRTVRQATEPGDSIPAVLEEARGIIPLNSRVCVRTTKKKMSPAVCGLFRPVILLPESLVKNLPASQLRAVLVHELVHIKRRDVWMNFLQALLQIIYWWHPLVWFANARIRRVREEAVDDAVMLALRDEADCYAPTLLEVAKLAFHRPLASLGLVGILESRGALRQRIERLVDFKMPRRTGISLVSFLGIAAFTALAVPMGEAPPKPVEVEQERAIPRVVVSNNPPIPTPVHDKIGFDSYLGDTLLSVAQNSSPPVTQPSAVATTASPLDGMLAFDKELKEATVNPGEAEAKFKFNLTNVSSFDVTITNILTSCGCTVAKMPSSPWLLAPGASGEIPVTMNLAGKSGVLTKTVSINSDKGTKVLTVKATIRPVEEIGSSDTQQTSRAIGSSVRDQSNARVDTLVLRKFKVDPNTFMEAIERETGIGFPSAPQATAVSTIPRVAVNGNSFVAGTVKTNPMSALQSAFIAFFRARGVDLSPPKHFFYGDRRGDLMVYATTEDLDLIEGAIQTLNTAPPQVVIRVKFIEMPTELAEALPIGWTNSPVAAPKLISILTSPQVRELIPALQNKNGVAELSNGNVTTLSGRQVQFQVVDLQMKTAMNLLNTNHLTLTNTLPTGPTLDVIPYVGDDGYNIHMTLIPTQPEFLGYDDPGKFGTQAPGTNGPPAAVLPLPHFRLRQVTTSVVVWDGQTVVLGGLIPKGGLPLIGKSFSDGQERALLIFVTPTIIDPAGNRVHTDEQLNSLPNINR